MRRIRRSIAPLLACGLAAACLLAGATAQASDHTPPVAQTLAPTAIAGTVIVLHGTVDAGHQRSTYWFEVGPTTAYGSATPPVTIKANGPVPVMGIMAGLLKSGTYHARLVARNDDGLSLGADVTFTGAGLIPAANPPAPGSNPGDDPGSDPASDSDPDTDVDAGAAPRSPRPRRPSSARPSPSPRRPATCSSACPAPRAPSC